MNIHRLKAHYQDESVARRYDRDRFASVVGRTFDRLEKLALVSVLRRLRRERPDPSVLDIPCGTGRITELWLQQGLRVTGGDISTEMMDVARERCADFGERVSWRRLDLDRLALDDGSVDLVTCIRLFHHLESVDRARYLKEIARVTRRHVLVNVSFSSPIYRLRRRLKRALGQGVSKTSSTWTQIEAECAAAGLSVVARRFVCPFVTEDLILLLAKTTAAVAV